MGVPVVTSRVAAGVVDAEAGAHLVVADSLREQAEAIIKLLDSPAERHRLALAGRQRVLSHHAWAQSMKRLDGIVERCVGQFKKRQGTT